MKKKATSVEKMSKLKIDIRLDKVLIAIAFTSWCFGFGWKAFAITAGAFIIAELISNKK